MKKIVFLILFGILFLGINNASATITQIAAPADVSTYVNAAADGDTIQLSTSGGAYTWSSQVDLTENTKGFTVRAASGLVTRPVVTFSGTTGNFIRLNSSSTSPTSKKLSFDGIEFDGYNTSATYYSSYFYYSYLTFGAYGEILILTIAYLKILVLDLSSMLVRLVALVQKQWVVT